MPRNLGLGPGRRGKRKYMEAISFVKHNPHFIDPPVCFSWMDLPGVSPHIIIFLLVGATVHDSKKSIYRPTNSRYEAQRQAISFPYLTINNLFQ